MQWLQKGWRGIVTGVMLFSAGVAAAPKADFLGRVAVEWDDTDLFNRHRVVMLADFGFQDAAGQQWIVRKGATLDGSSFTPLFEKLVGLPFVGEHRRAGIMHDYFAQQLTHDWQQVRRMYYEALLAEGLGVTEAKTAYAVLYGVGLRWEKKGSSCYVNCHGSATALRWRPDVTEAELEPVFELLNEGDPTLDEIDRAVDAAVPKPGPHLFSQLRREDNGALQRKGLLPKASAKDAEPEPETPSARSDLPSTEDAAPPGPEYGDDAEQGDEEAAVQEAPDAGADDHAGIDGAAREGNDAARQDDPATGAGDDADTDDATGADDASGTGR